MTIDEAVAYLQSIAITAVRLQSLASRLDQQEMRSLREMDDALNMILDYFEDEEFSTPE